MMWDVGYRHIEYLYKLDLKRYMDSLRVVVVTILLSVMLIVLVMFCCR